MKNTFKRILSLAFVAIMILSLSVPTFAADDSTVEVEVRVFDGMGFAETTVVKLGKDTANIKRILTNAESDLGVDFNIYYKTGTLRGVTILDGNKEIKNGSLEPYRTDGWYVAINGKVVNDALESYILNDKDVLTIFWGDKTLDTKLIQYDDSNIIKGIISFYYVNEEGEKVPVTGAKVELADKDGKVVLNKLETTPETDAVGDHIGDNYLDYHITDEKGQVWITPDHLDHENHIKIVSFDVEDAEYKVHKKDSDYDEDAAKFYAEYGMHNISTADVVNQIVEIDGDMYNVAGATGDNTMVYIVLMAAAVVTLGAVLVIKSGNKSKGMA